MRPGGPERCPENGFLRPIRAGGSHKSIDLHLHHGSSPGRSQLREPKGATIVPADGKRSLGSAAASSIPAPNVGSTIWKGEWTVGCDECVRGYRGRVV